MKKILLLGLLQLTCIFALAQVDVNAQHEKALSLYKENKFEEVIAIYESLMPMGEESAEVYYNLGNAYYKTNQFARAILCYERALLLKPYFEDASVNLELANTKVADKINAVPPFIVVRWVNSLAAIMTANAWAITSIVLLVLAILLFLVYVLVKFLKIRKIAFFSSLFIALLCICTLFIAANQKEKLSNRNTAIILSPTVEIRSVPAQSGTVVFLLHEGCKLTIKSTLQEWVEIQLADGKVGWMLASDLERI